MKRLFIMIIAFALFISGGFVKTHALDLEDIDYTLETPYFHYAGDNSSAGAYPLDIEFEDQNGTQSIDVEVYRIDHDGDKVETLDSETLNIDNESVNYSYDFNSDADYPYQIEVDETVIRKGYVKPWDEDADSLGSGFHTSNPNVHIGSTVYNDNLQHERNDYDFNTAPDEYPAMHYASFEDQSADHFVRFSKNGDDNFFGLDINVNAVNDKFGAFGFVILPTDTGWKDFIDPDLHSWYEDEVLQHTMETVIVQDEGGVEKNPMYPDLFTEENLDGQIYYNGEGGAPPEALPFAAGWGLTNEDDNYFTLLDNDDGGAIYVYFKDSPGHIETATSSNNIEAGDVLEFRLLDKNVEFDSNSVYDYGYYDRGELKYDYNEPLILDDYDYVIDLDFNKTELRQGEALNATLNVPNAGVRETYDFNSDPSNNDWIDDMLENGSATWSQQVEENGSQIEVFMESDSTYRDDEFDISADYTVEKAPTLNERIDTWLGGEGESEFFKLMIGLSLIIIITIGLSLMRASLPSIMVADIVTLMALIALGFIPSWLIIILGLGSIGLIFIIAFHYYGGVNR